MPPKAKSSPMLDLIERTNKDKTGLQVGLLGAMAEDTVAISSGNLAIDHILGVDGFPIGRSIELFGPPSCGKTTTALQNAKRVQDIIKSGGDPKLHIAADDYILYMDYEQALDPEYTRMLGLDVEHESFLFSQPDTLEDGVNFAIAAVKTGKIALVIFDSVAHMNPSAKAEAEIGKSLPAIQAKLMKDFTLQFNVALYQNHCTAVFLNHIMEKMSMGAPSRPGLPPATTTPGGSALKFFASVRVEYKQIKQEQGMVFDELANEKVKAVVATDVKVKVVKSKVSPPFKTATVRVRYGKGFDNFWSAMQVLMAHKLVMYQTGYYYLHKVEDLGLVRDDMPRAQSGTKRPYLYTDTKLYAYAEKNPDWRQGIIDLAIETLKTSKIANAQEPEEDTGQDDEDVTDEQVMDSVEAVDPDEARPGQRISI